MVILKNAPKTYFFNAMKALYKFPEDMVCMCMCFSNIHFWELWECIKLYKKGVGFRTVKEFAMTSIKILRI